MNKFEVSLKDLRQAGACYPGYNKLVRSIQGVPFTEEDEGRQSYIHHAHKEPVPIISILETNGLDDALWALRCVPEVDQDARLFAVWCARKVQHLMEDSRSINALDVAERFARREATTSELAAARAAADNAARTAARTAARAAADDAAWTAAWTAAEDAAWTAARDAAWTAARDSQAEMFKLMCQGQAPWQTVKALSPWKTP